MQILTIFTHLISENKIIKKLKGKNENSAKLPSCSNFNISDHLLPSYPKTIFLKI